LMSEQGGDGGVGFPPARNHEGDGGAGFPPARRPEGALSPAEQGELRHDLRTPFNHILGYTEMLLESAEEDGLEALGPELKQLHAGAGDLLGAVTAGLAPDRAVGAGERRALGGLVQERLAPLAGLVESLLEQARRGGHEAAVGDLERVRQSAAALAGLAGG